MSVVNWDGERVDRVSQPSDLIADIHSDFTRGNHYQQRRLAAFTLAANGWKLKEIARVLGWAAEGHVCRVIHSTREDLEKFLTTGERPSIRSAKPARKPERKLASQLELPFPEKR